MTRPAINRGSRGRAHGFTLMELLIAVVAFAIVLAAINGIFYGALRLRNKTTQSIEAALPLQQTLGIIKRDLANIVPPGGTLFGELQTTPTSGSNSVFTGGSALQIMNPGQSSPQFYTAAGIIEDDAPWGEVERVHYHLTAPTNQTDRIAGMDLFRSVTRNLLPSVTEEAEDQFLMSGVQAIAFLFFDGYNWRDTWYSSAEETPLPSAIKLRLQLAAETGRVQPPPVELVVPLVVEAVTNQTDETEEAVP